MGPGERNPKPSGSETAFLSSGGKVAKAVREYSREFHTPENRTGGSYSMHKIPLQLLRQVKAKAKREGVSIRAMLLRRMAEYLEEPSRTATVAKKHRNLAEYV